MSARKVVRPISISLITLLAFGLRAYRLDFQSYWIDEGLTVFYAQESLSQLWTSLQTVRAVPPLYHVLILYWSRLLNDGEYALRFVSLIFSIMSVPLTYRLGKTLGGYSLGLTAALLMAVSPYQIWHAQDARNYSMLTAASIASMWAFVNLFRRGGWRWSLFYIAVTEWAIMTHYHGLIVIGIQGLFLLITWQRHWRHYLTWGGLLAIVLLPYAAWLWLGSQLWQSDHWLPLVPLFESYLRSAIAYSVGELVPRPLAVWLTLIFLLFFVIGVGYAGLRRWGPWRGWEMAAFLLVYTLAPNAAAWLFSELRTPVYLERYLIPVQVGYLLAIACGVLAVRQGLTGRLPVRTRQPISGLIGAAAMLCLIVPGGWVLYHHYIDPVYAKPDWRRVIRTIEAFSLPGDAVLMTGDGGEHLFKFYYTGDLPVYTSFNTPVPGPDEAKERIAAIAADHRRLWYTPYGVEIDGLLEGWLAEHSYPAWHAWLGRKRLALYDTQPLTAAQIETLDAHFPDAQGQGPTLSQLRWPTEPVAAGDLFPLDFTWLTTTPLPTDYKISLRLVNAQGDQFAQSDWPSLTALVPTRNWPINQPVSDHRAFWIPPETPPGHYAMQIVLYEPETGAGLGQPLAMPDLEIKPAVVSPPLSVLTLPNPIEHPLGPLTLVGYAAPEQLQPGQEMWLWLYWQARQSIEEDAVIHVGLSSGQENTAADFSLAEAAGDLTSWQPGQVRRTVYHLPTSPRLIGEKAEITIGVSAGAALEEIVLAREIELDVRSRTFTKPQMEQTLDIAFGSPPELTLLGASINVDENKSNETLPVTLFWRAESEMKANYTVFIQLLNQNDQIVAQNDQYPLNGVAPTSTWLPSEILTDPHQLALPALAAGQYRLIVGMYDAATGRRLPVNNGQDYVELVPLTIQ